MIRVGATRKEIDEYYNLEKVSQSYLKELKGGLYPYLASKEKKKDESRKPYFLIGEGVDTIITEGLKSFNNRFYVSAMDDIPGGKGIEIVDLVFDMVLSQDGEIIDIENPMGQVKELADYSHILSIAIDTIGYYPNWTMTKRVDDITKKFSDYFNELKNSYNKHVISGLEHKLIIDIVTSLTTHPYTKDYFGIENAPENVEIWFQVPIFFEIGGIECKALLDEVFVLVNEKREAIKVIPIDIKTTGGYTSDFPNAAKRLDYQIQAAFYTDALTNPSAIFPEDFPTIISSTTIQNFTFIVESSIYPGRPLVYEVTENYLGLGRVGDLFKEGYLQLLAKHKFYVANQFTEEVGVRENKGKLFLDTDKRW